MFKKPGLQGGRFASFLSDSKLLQMNVARDGSGNVEYVGYSAPGTPEDETGWVIMKYSYTGSDIDKGRLADAIVDFDKVWDDRTGYNY